MEDTDGAHAASSDNANGSSGTYLLRELITSVPVQGDDDSEAHITCVDAWNGNLYIGTSAGEVLHYVSIPSDPSDESGQPTYIFATKISPEYTTKQEGADSGVKQILVLADVGKACILCNGTLTFYTLPELSPAFGNRIKQGGCSWVGGMDNNVDEQSSNGGQGKIIVICLKQRLRVIRIGEEAQPRKLRDIELAGVTALQRRDDLACVADSKSYSLLDIVNQRKNELFPIMSQSSPEMTPAEPETSRSHSLSSTSPVRQARGHERNISTGGASSRGDHLGPGNTSAWPDRRSSRNSLSPQPRSRDHSPAACDSPSTSARASAEVPRESVKLTNLLPPNIAAPTANEYLVTTGTKLSEPGIGMFVNLDGDVSRGTIEFSSYPDSLVLDGKGLENDEIPEDCDQGGYVLALVRKPSGSGYRMAIEVQRWDTDPGESHRTKEWIFVNHSQSFLTEDERMTAGLRVASTGSELLIREISEGLRLRRLPITPSEKEPSEAETKRNEEEDRFASRFAQGKAKVLFYDQDKVYWVHRNALILQLENQLATSLQKNAMGEVSLDTQSIQRVINSIRGQDASNELEFLTLTYIRQKASLMLFGHLVLQTMNGVNAYEGDKRSAEDALLSGDVDPRIVLTLVPPLAAEVMEGDQGIWIAQGLRDTISMVRQSCDLNKLVQDPNGPYGDNLLPLIKRYLFAWRKKKGFGSVADESHVFHTVDAALLHVLLMLDQDSPLGPAVSDPPSIRAELNEVVDRGVDCFDRAIELFTQYNRLYMLSRLYQSRKMTAQVLATWKRIIEGETDAGGELIDGEQHVRKYLSKLRDPNLVRDYGCWLANRNPKVGVEVFADDMSRVKFQPTEAVAMLKEKAPSAVKDYLEHLVFGQNHVRYVNDLIAFYLETVLAELNASETSKLTLIESYETYRALQAPKPTYRQFISDNAIDAEWWRNRVRLLQLIGGSHGAASKYDVRSLRERLAPYSNELVPEMIILNGREGKHDQALQLLVHGLGDYDTAIRYCLLGGLSIFHPTSSSAPEQPLPTKEEQSVLFNFLLHQFFSIEDVSERLERTSELLERFGAWFDIAEVLNLIPDSWSVEAVSQFLVHALRKLVEERHETAIVKALSGAQNLKQAVAFIEKTEALGPTIVNATVESE
ncbi:Hypothetical protein R9X50_00639200 [Acrodontium crateriforme]|uniref:CNH domain-containing protein n=1 Tax=Acrodontium crateriforme TaxID=150365 RepID=A0AAQ3MD83_9PEZI|nr:Hypothetical protein R9X50_00639200 [Acrodontium crateriforme]